MQGGTWAGKTYGIIPCLITKAATFPQKKITVVAESIPAIKDGALENFQNIMQSTGRWLQERFNATERSYRFHNSSEIQFTSFDSLGKAKAAGKRTDLFINEGNYISYDIADALIMRTSEEIWIDFNPTNEFWAHTEILPQPDAEFLLLKYTDNECLPTTILNELLNKMEKAKTSDYWRNWCRIYIDGEIGTLEGLVFQNWRQCDDIPEGAVLLACGMDFGYTNDPTTLIACYRFNNEIYFDELIYRKGLLNSEIAALVKSKAVGNTIIYADSAEPKSISEIKLHGINITAVVKGVDSINFGISILQENNFYVMKKSLNLIKELRSYSWDADKSGASINKPIDAWNHCIDAMRYIALSVLKSQQSPSIIW